MARHRRPEPQARQAGNPVGQTWWPVTEPVPQVAPPPEVWWSEPTAEECSPPREQVAEQPIRRHGGERARRHRAPSRSNGRVVLASVAAGAILAGGTSTAHAGSAERQAHIRLAGVGEELPASAPPAAGGPALLLELPSPAQLAAFADQLARGRDREVARAQREAEARRPRTLAPVSGTLTSSFGPRWGTNHNGLDIANAIGTPIVAVTDGTVLEAGPADGFGLWIRVRQDDGTIGVYGHMNEIFVAAGQRLRAGDTIATVGNRGQSTGPHLHYEVWGADGGKADPLAWLRARGIDM